MNYPFPGMNPYLENPDLWSEVHHRLITAIAIAISPPLRPKYRVAIEKRTYSMNTEDAILEDVLKVETSQKLCQSSDHDTNHGNYR